MPKILLFLFPSPRKGCHSIRKLKFHWKHIESKNQRVHKPRAHEFTCSAPCPRSLTQLGQYWPLCALSCRGFWESVGSTAGEWETLLGLLCPCGSSLESAVAFVDKVLLTDPGGYSCVNLARLWSPVIESNINLGVAGKVFVNVCG